MSVYEYNPRNVREVIRYNVGVAHVLSKLLISVLDAVSLRKPSKKAL